MEKVAIIILVMITGMKELCEGCIESERNGLLQIKSSFPPNSPNILSSWGTSDPDCCTWERVQCDYVTGHVTSLYLSSFMTDFDSEDSLYLNASLFLPFPRLKSLDLGYNNIAGCIHNEGFERLSSTLTNLESLMLEFNKFNNTILQSLSGFSSLKFLYLSSNKLKGTINITELNNLASTLQTLRLEENEIEGFGSSQVKFNNIEVKFLDLGYNNFKGPFNFTEIDCLSNLQRLDLSGNEITEFIVSKDSRGSIANLSSLYLDNTTTTTGISNLLQHLPTLKTLSLRYNHFRGLQVFGEECFNKLEELYLSFSQFNSTTTDVLRSIGRMSSLKRLSLAGCGLSGNIASQGLKNLPHLSRNFIDFNGNLTSLQYLDLSHNLFQIPISLSPFFNLSQLTVLHIANNTIYADTEDRNLNPKFQLEYLSINGYGEGEAFPKFLYHQHNLKQVTISNLKLRGAFPYWLLQNNTGLTDLDLSNNSLSGNLQLLYNHESMTHLDISNNFFNGSISSLERLDLAANNLEGKIPDGLLLLVKLTYLNLFDNNLSGEIPEGFSKLHKLETLILNKNELKGKIPDGLCNSASLMYLDLSHNNISGTIPNCIGNMSQLRILDLSNNKVSGSLPANFSSSSLAIINLSKNRLQGSLKNTFYSTSYLFQLDLSHNNFSGSIPPWIGELSQLSFLVLGYNNFQGEIPVELCKLKQLSFIDLSRNKIVGHMLRCLNLTSYWSREQSIIRMIENIEITMKGHTYMYEEQVLRYVSGIDVSSNYLTGQIPIEIGDLRSIKTLNLSKNCFTGTIPSTFSNLKEIESLDLSYNNLQGTIPPKLTQLTSLTAFNVSYNNLSGKTPNQAKQFATFDESSYRGNPLLCGWPLAKSCGTLDSPQSHAKTEESNNKLIDMDDFFVSFGVAYAMVLLTLAAVLSINPYWRRVWFYYIQLSIDKTCYFIIDNVIPFFSMS